jgi:hypothetical protein
MHFRAKGLLLLGATNTVTGYLNIPWVDSVVELMKSESIAAVDYNGAHVDTERGDKVSSIQQVLKAVQSPAQSERPHGPPEDGPEEPPPTPSYWLEKIKHQGIAAFNPKPSGYQVYRNVKDFGAKGNSQLLR